MKFVDFAATWQKKGRPKASKGWRVTQDQMLRSYLVPILGSLRVEAIKTPNILDVLAHMEDLKRSAQTRLHVFNLMFSIFDFAIECMLFEKNPVLPKYRPEVRHKEAKYLHPEHAFMFLAAAVGHRYELGFNLQILCGLRVGEVQALTWDCIDWDKEEVIIRKKWNKKSKEIEDFTKNGRDNRVPIPSRLFANLKKKRKPSGFIIHWETKMVSYTAYSQAIKKVCRDNDIEEIATHGLRHSASEIWARIGATEIDIGRLLNHMSSKTTQKYMHRTNDRLKELAGRIGTFYESPKMKRSKKAA